MYTHNKMAAAMAQAVMGAGKEALGLASMIQGWVMKSKTQKAKDRAKAIFKGTDEGTTKAEAKLALALRPSPIIPEGYTLAQAGRHGLAGEYVEAERQLELREEEDVQEIVDRLEYQDRADIGEKIQDVYDEVGWDVMVVALRELVAEANDVDAQTLRERAAYQAMRDATSAETSQILVELRKQVN